MKNKKVLVCGVYDLIHRGHIEFFKKASKFGNLYVGIVCDKAVKKQKGKNRPIISENDRFEIVKSLNCVYEIFMIDDFYFPEIEKYDFIVVGEDQNHFKNLNNIPQNKKIILKRYKCVSTSDIIKKINGEK